ncbi:unnamed protein product [Ectocarpus sp. CCAP 1310/34]|nr:unnamed protein product [Ectocarpus sp. CCAP 1310/34]
MHIALDFVFLPMSVFLVVRSRFQGGRPPETMRTRGAAAREVGGGGSGGRENPTFDFSDGSGPNREDGSDSSVWVVPSVWTVPGDNTREYSKRYNPGRGGCGPYAVGQLASSETPSSEELAGYRLGGVQYVLDNPATFGDDFWEGDTPEERARSRQDWARRMLRPREWADYPLMLGMIAQYCSDAIIVEPKFPGDKSNRELKAYGEDVLEPSKPMIMIRCAHFVVFDEVRRGGDGGNGDGDGREPSSSSGGNSHSGSSGGGGANSGGSGRSSSSSSSSSGSSSSNSGSGSSSGGDLSPAQAAALAAFERNPKWFLRIEDRDVTTVEREQVEDLLRNPRRLTTLENGALRIPRVSRGCKEPKDLDCHQLRNLACSAILPENGLHATYDSFGGDLGRMRVEFDNAADGGLASFMDFLRACSKVTRPSLIRLAGTSRCHARKTTVTGKVARACDAVSPFVGGPVAKMNRTLASCVKIVTDRDGSSIPHCPPVGLLRRELQHTAKGGDHAETGRAKNTAQELVEVGGRRAWVYYGNHQCRALGAEEALESSVRGALELHRACTDGESVEEEDVSNGMADLVGRVLDYHFEAQGGRETENDRRRYAELIEATAQGHAQVREKAVKVAVEIRGKATKRETIALPEISDGHCDSIALGRRQIDCVTSPTPPALEGSANHAEGALLGGGRGRSKGTRKGKAQGGTESIKKQRRNPQKFVEDRSTAGANGDREKKVVAGGQTSGNRRGSEVPFASRLQPVPGVALFCDGCGKDWCHFPRSRGVARGCVDEEKAVVTVMQERHWKCKKRCKPAEGAAVRIGGVEYTVKSTQNGQFRAQSV